MLKEVIELKHGDLKARLLFCNRAYRDARHELGNLFSFDDLEDSVKQLNFIISYLYFSYVSQCKNEGQSALLHFIDFDEAITGVKVPESESNLVEIIGKAGDTIKVYFGNEIENVKKKIEEIQSSQKKSQPMTNSNKPFAENLDTNQENSGTNSTGERQTTSSEDTIKE